MYLYEALEQGFANWAIARGLKDGTIKGCDNMREWQRLWWPPEQMQEAHRRGFITQ